VVIEKLIKKRNMRFLTALDQKGLRKEDLAKTTQKKIDDLGVLVDKLNDFQESDELSEELQDEYDRLVDSVNEIDEKLMKSILRFDVESYKIKVANLKQGGKASKAEKVQEVAPVAAPVQAQEKTEDKLKAIEERLNQLKPEVQIQPEKFETATKQELEPEYVHAEEAEEFEKKAEVKPKNMSLNIVLIGVGAFFLTWGAVNLFRERRQ
jgi:tRNA A37 threonylcarbamoyladenosine dehydratase